MHKLRNDFILIGSLVALAVIGLILCFTLNKNENIKAYVYYDKEQVAILNLNENQEFEINSVVVVVEDQKVYVRSSACKDKLCVHQGKIEFSGQTITCLPQRVYIKIAGSGVDVGI